VAHFQNKGKPRFMNKWYNKILYSHFFKDIYAVFLSQFLLKEFQSYINKGHAHICPNSIPVTYKNNDRTEPHNPFIFLFLSNMMEEKGVWILLEACSILKEKGYDFQCDYIGRWSDISEDEFTEKVTEYRLMNHVKAHGAKYESDKHEFLYKADAFVFPTFYHGEAFPLVLLEAMEYALPCISTYEGSISEIIENKRSGFLVKQKDVESLANKMIYMIEHPNESIEMGNYGRVLFLKKYAFDIFEQKFINIINQIIH
jgi:glycosyltransferase involved in cell wall biosynthesis